MTISYKPTVYYILYRYTDFLHCIILLPTKHNPILNLYVKVIMYLCSELVSI